MEKKDIKMSSINIPNVTIPSWSAIVDNRKQYVTYGDGNKFPKYLWELYVTCELHQAIIDGSVDYIIGEGVSTTYKFSNFEGDKVNRYNESLTDVFAKVVTDFKIFGGFALQVIYDLAGNVAELIHLNFDNCRVNADRSIIYYSDKWGVNSGAKAIQFHKFNLKEENKTSQVYYYVGNKTRTIYPIPSYIGALKAIETQNEIKNFNLKSIKNNFSASTIININSNPTNEEKEQIVDYLTDSATGSDNAGSFLVFFNKDKDNSVTIEPFESADFKDRFTTLEKATMQSIYIGHRVTSPHLFGLIAEGTGFNSVEYQESFTLFNKTVIYPSQKELIRCFSDIIGDFTIKPFTISFLNNNNNL